MRAVREGAHIPAVVHGEKGEGGLHAEARVTDAQAGEPAPKDLEPSHSPTMGESVHVPYAQTKALPSQARGREAEESIPAIMSDRDKAKLQRSNQVEHRHQGREKVGGETGLVLWWNR